MNKENKSLNLALRILIILTWIMSNISLFAIASGMSKLDTNDLKQDNMAERLLDIIGDFASKTTFYYITLGMVIACLALSIITRYKTTLVSYIFKILSLLLAMMTLISGLTYVNALRACKGLSDIKISGTSAEEVASALSSAGLDKNVDDIAKTLTDANEAGAALAGYMFPILILFILTITSIHCLVKKKDPNNKNKAE